MLFFAYLYDQLHSMSMLAIKSCLYNDRSRIKFIQQPFYPTNYVGKMLVLSSCSFNDHFPDQIMDAYAVMCLTGHPNGEG